MTRQTLGIPPDACVMCKSCVARPGVFTRYAVSYSEQTTWRSAVTAQTIDSDGFGGGISVTLKISICEQQPVPASTCRACVPMHRTVAVSRNSTSQGRRVGVGVPLISRAAYRVRDAGRREHSGADYLLQTQSVNKMCRAQRAASVSACVTFSSTGGGYITSVLHITL